MQLTVELKDQYGTQVVYPVCDNSKLFARLAGTRTLTPSAISLIKQLGYEIIVKPAVVSL